MSKVGRPKSEATRIKELESRIKDLERELIAAAHVANTAREAPIEMSIVFFDMWCILNDMVERYDSIDEGLILAHLKALTLMADKGSEMHC